MIGQRKKKKCSEEKLVCCRYRRNLSAEPCVRDSLNLRGRVLISCSEIPSASLEVVISSQKSGKYDSLSPTVMWCDTSEDIDVVPRYPMNFHLMKALLKIYQTLLLFRTSNQMLRFWHLRYHAFSIHHHWCMLTPPVVQHYFQSPNIRGSRWLWITIGRRSIQSVMLCATTSITEEMNGYW
jgi:hypothetical protein